jgi:hypothetical protein
VLIFISTCSITAMIVCILEHTQWRWGLNGFTTRGAATSSSVPTVRWPPPQVQQPCGGRQGRTLRSCRCWLAHHGACSDVRIRSDQID